MPGRILIADDQVNILDALRLLLGGEGHDVTQAQSPAELLAALERSDFDVALIDLNYARDTTSGHEGFELLDRINAIDATLPVLVMTGWSSVTFPPGLRWRGACFPECALHAGHRTDLSSENRKFKK